ncbi:MAG: alpha/beta hydrolase [Euryarchaeota archaeon]|nr:alpha/beta hydrolase [Euryarchaeota archaeon]MDE1879700.1 alpha/beta hydrolase [Euryarchaeota archaeon]
MGEAPLTVEEKFVEVEGVKIRYLSSTPPAGASPGLPLLLIHGYIASAETWDHVVDALGARHPIVRLDLPDHHRSAAIPDKDHSMARYRKIVGAFLRTLPAPTWGLVGNSIGGMLSAMAALDLPEKVDRLVLLDPAGLVHPFPSSTVRLYTPLILPAMFFAPSEKKWRKFLGKSCFCDPKFVEDGWVRQLREEWGPRARRKPYLAAGMAVRKHDASLAQNLEKIRCPTLLIWGRQDVQFNVSIGEAAVKRIPGAKLSVLENCGHMPQIEKPKETAEAILSFLDGPGP